MNGADDTSATHKPRRRDRLRAFLTSKTSDASATASQPAQSLTGRQDHPAPSLLQPSTSHVTAPVPSITPGGLPTASTTAASASIGSQAQTQAQTTTENDLLQGALSRLSSEERRVIESISPLGSDVSSVLDEALAAAEQQKRLCHEKRWTINFRGRNIVLAEQADKVVKWLDNVKFAGDILVSADPVHAGLPWAAFRLILEAAAADSKQLAAILDGCDVALYAADRLKVYLEHTRAIPPSSELTNLKSTLTDVYTCVLGFLARAIIVYQKNVLKRTLTAAWTAADIQDFERRCEQLTRHAHEDASACEFRLSSQERSANSVSRRALANLLQELDKWQTTQHTVQNIETQLYLDKIPFVTGAMFNSSGESNPTCHPDTRVDLLCRIMNWSQDTHGKPILWLQGKAGTGKSTISRTVAHRLHSKQQLGASFFFKRGELARGTATRFFPTIAHQLSINMPEFSHCVAAAIKEDPLIFDRAITEQFEKLIYQPMSLSSGKRPHQSIICIVIDALDECENDHDVRTIITLWSRLFQLKDLALMLFVTSRPEPAIRIGFRKVPVADHHDVDLHDLSENVTRNDILTFLQADLAQFQEEYDLDPAGVALGADWPGEADLRKLVDIAHPLFIVASTISRFIQDPNCLPRRQLELMLAGQKVGQMSHIEQTYRAVLEQLPSTLSDVNARDSLYRDFRETVGSIVCLNEPLSARALSALLAKDLDLIQVRLRPLRSVLYIPSNDREPTRPLHLSFADFLMSKNTQNLPFGIDEKATHTLLYTDCLQVLSGPHGLHENMCQLNHAGQLRQDVCFESISQHLSEAMQYACCHWTYHLQKSQVLLQDGDQTHGLLRVHFLHWVESMSMMGKSSECVSSITALQDLVAAAAAPRLSALLQDARRFLLANSHLLDLAPLQIYKSALFFSPQQSIVKRIFDCGLDMMSTSFAASGEWDSHLTTLTCSGPIFAVAFSHNGRLIAATSPKTVAIWEVSTAKQLQTVVWSSTELVSRNVEMTFSSTDETVIIGLDTSVVHIDLASMDIVAEDIDKYVPKHSTISSIKASPDGGLYAGVILRSEDGIMEGLGVMDLIKQTLTNVVVDVSFCQRSTFVLSPDCSSVAGFQASPWLWPNLFVRRLMGGTVTQHEPTLYPGVRQAHQMALSPQNKFIATGDYDTSIKLFDLDSGDLLRVFRYDARWPRGLAFAPGNNLLACAAWESVYLWDLDIDSTRDTSDQVSHERNHLMFERLSYNGRFAISNPLGQQSNSSDHEPLQIWNTSSGVLVKQLSNTCLHDIEFSYDDNALAVRSSGGICVYNTENWAEIARIPRGHFLQQDGSSFSPDGKQLAIAAVATPAQETNDVDVIDSSAIEYDLVIWDVARVTWRVLMRVPKSFDFGVRMITAFSIESQFFACRLSSGAILVWDLETGLRIRTLDPMSFRPLRDHYVVQLAFQGTRILLLADDHTRRWGIDQVMILWDFRHDHLQFVHLKSNRALDIDWLAPQADCHTVHTKVGTMVIDNFDNPQKYEWTGIGFHNGWIIYRGRNLLWVPPERRHLVSISGDRKIVFVTDNDRFIVFELDLAALEKEVAPLIDETESTV